MGAVRHRPPREGLLADQGRPETAGTRGSAVAALHRHHRALLQHLGGVGVSRPDRDLDDEVAGHLAEAEADYVARWLSPQEARYAALRDFGGVTQVKQLHR